MLKQQAKLFTKIAVAVDAGTVVGAFFAAYYLRSAVGKIQHVSFYSWILFIALPVLGYFFFRFQLYASLRTRPTADIIIDVVKAHILGGLVISSVIYLLEPRGFSRGLFLNFILISLSLIILEKLLVKAFLSYVRRSGYNYRNILIVGCNARAQNLTGLIEQNADWGLKVVGFLQHPEKEPQIPLKDYKILGSLGELADICKKLPIDEVVFCVPMGALPNMEDEVRDMQQMGVTVRMVLDFYDMPRSKQELSLFDGRVPMLTFYPRSFNADHLFLKRCLDILGAVTGLFITCLFFPFIALVIKMDSPGPIFFCQQRVGERGRTFKCWKFRSMYADAEERKKELLPLNEMNGAIFKIKNDPRITRVGAFLRKTSLDEFPQFWNVLKGEMSLVGTRPPIPEEMAEYEIWHRKRICIKPGLTGLWQVSGRNGLQNFDEVAKLDIEYIEKWSLWLDIKILLKTVWVVFSRNGSY